MSTNRIAPGDVKEIFETSLTTDEIQPFVDAANALVDEQLGSSSLSSDLLAEIERWVAASLLHARDPRVSEESVGDGSTRFQGRSDMGLQSNRYGQHAVTLDPTGQLARASSGQAKKFLAQMGPLEENNEL